MCPCVRLYIGDCPRSTKLHSNVRACVCMCLCVRVCVFSFFCLVIVIQLSPAPAPSQRAGTIHSIALSATDTPLLQHPSTLCHTSHPILALIPKVYSLKKIIIKLDFSLSSQRLLSLLFCLSVPQLCSNAHLSFLLLNTTGVAAGLRMAI